MAPIIDQYTEQDAADLVAFLLGGRVRGVERDHGADDVPPNSPGVLRRLLASFPGDPIGPQQTITAPAAATGLAVPDRANSAVVSVETQSVRARFDGGAPTAAVGLLLTTGTLYTLTGRATLNGAQFIQVAAGAVVTVSYFT